MKNRRLQRKIGLLVTALLLLEVLAVVALAAPTPNEIIADSTAVVREMSQQDDVSTMARLVSGAKGIAVFPSVIKAGLILGGRHGEGLVLRRNPNNGQWYGPCFFEITGLSWGLQIGVQETALILVVNTEDGMNVFNGDNITLGGEFSIAAGPVGRQAQAGTDVELSASIYSYSMSKGLFAGFSLEGAKIDDDPTANQLYWGSSMSPENILANMSADERVNSLIREIAQLIAKAE